MRTNQRIEELALKVTTALDDFMQNEMTLFAVDAHEQAITAQFAAYLGDLFSDWDIDCEYNRNRHKAKETERGKIKPDIIIHHRNTPENFLAIEANKNKAKPNDIDKLISLTQEPFNYQLGLMIVFEMGDPPKRHLRWFREGLEFCIG